MYRNLINVFSSLPPWPEEIRAQVDLEAALHCQSLEYLTPLGLTAESTAPLLFGSNIEVTPRIVMGTVSKLVSTLIAMADFVFSVRKLRSVQHSVFISKKQQERKSCLHTEM